VTSGKGGTSAWGRERPARNGTVAKTDHASRVLMYGHETAVLDSEARDRSRARRDEWDLAHPAITRGKKEYKGLGKSAAWPVIALCGG